MELLTDLNYYEPNQVKWQGSRPGRNGQQVFVNLEQIGVGELPFYTVPAGSTLFITAFHYSLYRAAVFSASIRIYNAVPALVGDFMVKRLNSAVDIFGDIAYYYPFELAAGYALRLNVDVALCRFNVSMIGWIE